jgi:hypothetical protein
MNWDICIERWLLTHLIILDHVGEGEVIALDVMTSEITENIRPKVASQSESSVVMSTNQIAIEFYSNI